MNSNNDTETDKVIDSCGAIEILGKADPRVKLVNSTMSLLERKRGIAYIGERHDDSIIAHEKKHLNKRIKV